MEKSKPKYTPKKIMKFDEKRMWELIDFSICSEKCVREKRIFRK